MLRSELCTQRLSCTSCQRSDRGHPQSCYPVLAPGAPASYAAAFQRNLALLLLVCLLSNTRATNVPQGSFSSRPPVQEQYPALISQQRSPVAGVELGGYEHPSALSKEVSAVSGLAMLAHRLLSEDAGGSYRAQIVITEGTQPQLVSWKIECGNDASRTRSGFVPFFTGIIVFPGEICVLNLYGTEAGGSYGATFYGLGLQGATFPPGGNGTFVIVIPPAPSPNPPPQSTALPPLSPPSPPSWNLSPTTNLPTPAASPPAPQAPFPIGARVVRTTQEIREALQTAQRGESLHLHLSPAESAFKLGGDPLLAANINLTMSSNGEGAILDGELNSQLILVTENANVQLFGLQLVRGRSQERTCVLKVERARRRERESTQEREKPHKRRQKSAKERAMASKRAANKK